MGTAAGLLERAGVGDRIILQLGNTPEAPITYLAAIAAGIVPVMLSSQLTAPEFDRVVAEIEPVLVIREKDTANIELPFGHLRDLWQCTAADFKLGDPHRPAYIIYTSGTSGKPRAVVHAHRAVWARQMMYQGWYGLSEDDRLLHAGAFNWTYTLGTGLMDPWSTGATALIPREGVAADALPALLEQHRASIFAAAPGVYRRMLRAPFPSLPHLRHGLSAGEKLAADYRKDWEQKTQTRIHEAFGMSECSTFISGCPDYPAPEGALGFAQPGRRVAIVGDDGPVPFGTSGLIAVHRSDPGLMLSYLGAPQETAGKYHGDWFVTGDVGRMDDTGAITYDGRADDMMNAGGYRVSPIEVEDALTAHPQVTDAAACAVQVRTGTFVIAAFYVATDVIEEATLREFVEERLAGYKCPRLYIATDALPRGANNKLLRRVLRQEWEASHGQT